MQRELTLRALLLGGAITLVFTAANVYLGLKVGLTFASSIPAAVISMAVLRAFRNGTIVENNIVQTVASAAGTLSSVIFVLPGLVMVGWWAGFPFWESFWIIAAGGVLGVMYSVPLRRALVTHSDLPYPEGVAAAEVLKVGAGEHREEAAAENRTGLVGLVVSSLASAGFQLLSALQLFASSFGAYFRFGAAATGIGLNGSLALIGAGHLIGLTVGLAIFAGLFIAWGIAMPILTTLHPTAGAAGDVAIATWSHYVRFIGAGAIGVSAIWAIARLIAPVWHGLSAAMAASRAHRERPENELPIVERDMPIGIVALVSLVSLVPIAIALEAFLHGGALGSLAIVLVIAAIVYIVIAGFFVAAACGYMAGLIGSSNSPVSGLAILSVIGASLLLLVFAHSGNSAVSAALVAYALFVAAVLINVATISNDNLQDPQDGPARRRHAVEAAGGARRRRLLRRARHPADPQSSEQSVRLRRLARIAGAASDPHLDARKRRYRGADRLESHRRRSDRRSDRRRHRRAWPHHRPLSLAAAGSRARNLSSRAHDGAGSRRRGLRCALQSLGRAQAQCCCRTPPRCARRIGAHRRREPLRRSARRHHRLQRKGNASRRRR